MMALEPPATMCRCGKVWLLAGVTVFAAEGRTHTESSCWVQR